MLGGGLSTRLEQLCRGYNSKHEVIINIGRHNQSVNRRRVTGFGGQKPIRYQDY